MSIQPGSTPPDSTQSRSTSKTEVMDSTSLQQQLTRAEGKIDAQKIESQRWRDEDQMEVPDMVERDGALFRADPKDKKMEGPFCIRCFKNSGKLVPVLPLPETFAMSASAEWDCTVCKQAS